MKTWDAVICVECDEVMPISAKQCPSCTSTVVLPLSAIVSPRLDPDEIDSVRTAMKRIEKPDYNAHLGTTRE